MPLPLGLIVEEEKRLVLPDRTTHCAAELVQIELFPAGGEITAGIEIGVTEELEQTIRGSDWFRISWLPAPSDPRAYRTQRSK